jgi:hypothetical protein
VKADAVGKQGESPDGLPGGPDGLDAGTIMRLFQRSMPVSRKDPFKGPEPERGD